MYYVWYSRIRVWRNAIVQLVPDGWRAGIDTPSALTCDPITEKLPAILAYRLYPPTAPLTDLMESACTFDLYSPTAVALLRDFDVRYETVPALVRNKRGKVVATDYVYLHLLGCLPAVDWGRSDVEAGASADGDRYIKKAAHVVLTEEVERMGIPVFRLAESMDLVLASERFRQAWEERGLTGATFLPLPAYHEK